MASLRVPRSLASFKMSASKSFNLLGVIVGADKFAFVASSMVKLFKLLGVFEFVLEVILGEIVVFKRSRGTVEVAKEEVGLLMTNLKPGYPDSKFY